MKPTEKEDEVQRISIEQYNSEVAEALEEVKDGKYTTQEELEKEMLHW